MFPLVRYFSIASLIVLISGAGIILFGVHTQNINNLVELRERSNVVLTQTYANTLLTEYSTFIVQAGYMDTDEILASPEYQNLDADIRRLTNDTTIIKIKIFAPNGNTVYSSDLADIGEDKSEGLGFLTALRGGYASKLFYTDTFNAFEGNVTDRNIVESYVPFVTRSNNQVLGVIELYDDVTPLLNNINQQLFSGSIGLILLTIAVYVVLLSIVRHAENLMRKQHARIQQNVADLAKANVEVAKAARLKSEFLSTMSHELRTPLNAIIGYSGIITSGIAGEVNPKANNMVKRISDSGQHLLMLINNVLDISKIEAGRMTIVKDKTYVADMTASVAEQLQVLADDKNLHLDIHIDDTVPKLLMLDSERVKQILINLLSNGIKFTDVGTVSLGLAWEANTLTMKVSDTGVGIPPHAQDVIFDEFRQIDGSSTRTHQGTGLGLAIVRKFTEAMDGSVSLKSRVGEGSTFTVVLPAESVQQAMPQAV